ncbi:MAG: energy transducer TonB [Gemmatimonadota bacterium]
MLEARVQEGSGYATLDSVARRLLPAMEFEPAMNRDRPVAVWIRQRCSAP